MLELHNARHDLLPVGARGDLQVNAQLLVCQLEQLRPVHSLLFECLAVLRQLEHVADPVGHRGGPQAHQFGGGQRREIGTADAKLAQHALRAPAFAPHALRCGARVVCIVAAFAG